MKFCSQCGSSVALKIPEDDNRERYVCEDCQHIHYQNPNNVCGAILTRGDRVLLCKRAIEPRYGLWTLPAGFMENGETVAEAACREAYEEAYAKAHDVSLFAVFSMPYISQVYLMFAGELTDDDVSAGPESLEVGLYAEHEIPWQQLAFPVVGECLKMYFKHGIGKVHHAWFSRDDQYNHRLHLGS
ncbi:MAG: NUDIX hydrolase [Gammaproteobacteria bacterium]